MSKHFNTPKSKGQDKDSYRLTQLKTIFEYLQKHVATASMISDATSIPQKNICRYKRDLEKEGRLWEIKKATCKKTGFKAWYVTTNPKEAQNNQLSLF